MNQTTSLARPIRWLWLMLVLAALLAGCASASPAPAASPNANTPPSPAASSELAPASEQAALPTREDQQGAVTVAITPLNLNNSTTTLDFRVTLDTHSVDLSMDLAQLATLRTDTGQAVAASAWPVGSGHHYEATLSFPAQTADGRPLLEGAQTVTLVITELDAPERVFEWALTK